MAHWTDSDKELFDPWDPRFTRWQQFNKVISSYQSQLDQLVTTMTGQGAAFASSALQLSSRARQELSALTDPKQGGGELYEENQKVMKDFLDHLDQMDDINSKTLKLVESSRADGEAMRKKFVEEEKRQFDIARKEIKERQKKFDEVNKKYARYFAGKSY